MIIRNIDSNGDWVFGKGKNDYKKDQDALEVDLLTRLKSWRFDCFFDIDFGVDYKNFLDRGTKVLLDSDIKRMILQTDGVLRINKFESEITNDREYQAQFCILTVFGDLQSTLIV